MKTVLFALFVLGSLAVASLNHAECPAGTHWNEAAQACVIEAP